MMMKMNYEKPRSAVVHLGVEMPIMAASGVRPAVIDEEATEAGWSRMRYRSELERDDDEDDYDF